MCGIAGIIGERAPGTLSRMLQPIRHRGPDDSGQFEEGVCAIGMNRLAILDISPNGHQPMLSEDGRYVIVYNGEIYNFLELKAVLEKRGYVFKSSSDTEVLLNLFHCYGKECLAQIRGMFAFAIWDRWEKKLFAARDHFGIKPFFYANFGNEFIFCSELKGIKKIHPDLSINQDSLMNYMLYGYVIQPKTIYSNVFALPPGHALEWQNNRIKMYSYWRLEEKETYKALDYAAAIEATRELVLKSVKEQVISDVPLGIFLSGGLDSSIIAAAMKLNGIEAIEAFSIGFDNSGKSLDETDLAKETAKHLQVNNNHVQIDSDSIPGLVEGYLTGMDQPTIDGLNTYCVSKFARKKVTVALSGLGADEVFGGYEVFKHILHKTESQRWNLPFKHIRTIPEFVPSRVYQKCKTFADSKDIVAKFSLTNRFNFPVSIKKLSSARISRKSIDLSAYDDMSQEIDTSHSFYQQIVQLYVQKWMGPRLLNDTDIFSMCHSLEVRVPFLDIRLVELAYSLPAHYHLDVNNQVNGSYTQDGVKKLLYEAFKSNLPPDFGNRKKTGFQMPHEKWMRSCLRPLIHDTILSGNDFLEKDACVRLMNDWEKEKVRWYMVWNVFVLCHWLNNNHALNTDPDSRFLHQEIQRQFSAT